MNNGIATFRKAQRAYTYLKIGIEGPSGAGKTMGALLLAKGLASSPDKIALIDTENGSGELYSDDPRVGYEYLYARLEPPFTPSKYVEWITNAVNAGLEVLIIDSQSHAWKYILGYKEVLDSRGGNSYTNWGKVKPIYDELKAAILFSPIHIIACMRSKTEYSLQTASNGKTEVKKLGVNPIAEPENEYEFTCVFTVDKEHMATTMLTGKDRTGLFGDTPSFRITPQTGEFIKDWLLGTSAPVVAEEWTSLTAAGLKSTKEAEQEMNRMENAPTVPAQRPISKEGQILLAHLPIESERREWKMGLAAVGVEWKSFINAAPEDESTESFRERTKLLLMGRKSITQSDMQEPLCSVEPPNQPNETSSSADAVDPFAEPSGGKAESPRKSTNKSQKAKAAA